MNKLTETEKAYIAGILDGEGSISIIRVKSRSNTYKYDFYPKVRVQNTYFPIISWLKEKIGIGSIYHGKQRNPKWKSLYQWQILSNQAQELLREVRPYLRIKKELADLVLGFRKNEHNGYPRSSEVYQMQDELYYRMKALNKRGPCKIAEIK